MDKPEISKVDVEYVQDGNTLGTTQEIETLNISLQFQSDEKNGHFIVIKTDGWSMDDVSELLSLIDRTESILKPEKYLK